MDLQNFCVDTSRKAASPYRLLRTPSEKMAKSFHFPGVPVTDAFLEGHCFDQLPNMTCNAHINFQDLTKDISSGPKKTCFDQYNKLPTIAISKLVGGFVGSKSQGGASKEPHQVWDVVFRQIVETACQGSLKNNMLECINVGRTVSNSLFGPLNRSDNSTLDSSITYFFANHCNFFEGKKMVHNPTSSQSSSNGSDSSKEKSPDARSPLREEKCSEQPQDSPRQSYAEVAKAFAAKRAERMCDRTNIQSVPNPPLLKKCKKLGDYQNMKMRHGKKNDASLSRYLQSTFCSSQNQHFRKSAQNVERTMYTNKTKSHRDCERNDKCFSDNYKQQGLNSQQNCVPVKKRNLSDDRKPRFCKSKNYNMKEKEKKSIGQQVQDDMSFICNVSEQDCKNWRCKHNRMNSRQSNRVESQVPVDRSLHKASRDEASSSHASPPLAKVADGKKIDHILSDENSLFKGPRDLKESGSGVHASLSSQSSQESIGDTCSESSSSCMSTEGYPQRSRVVSECSIESEDSIIVFESEGGESSPVGSCNKEIEAESECSTDSETFEEDSDCDEVDLCQLVLPPTVAIDPDHYVSDWIQDVNTKWNKENAAISKEEKIAKKVHFADNEDLIRVHLMVTWDFAYRKARCGPWEQMARDRCRFQMRISRTEAVLAPVLCPQHRRKVWEERMQSTLM